MGPRPLSTGASREPNIEPDELWVLGQVRGGLAQVEARQSSASAPRALLPDSRQGPLGRPVIVLIAQSPAFRWERSLGVSSFPTNWRVEPLPLCVSVPQGIGLPGKLGHLYVGLWTHPGGGTRSLS